MRPVGPTLQENSRPDFNRPAQVHDAAPRGQQFTLSTDSPCVLAIARAFSAACPAGVFVPKHPASNSAGANAAASGVGLRSKRLIPSREPIAWSPAQPSAVLKENRLPTRYLGRNGVTPYLPSRSERRPRQPV
jgi:hypothetical protein